MKGERVEIQGGEGLPLLASGQYAKYKGTWYFCTPNGHAGNLGGHDVTEHDDGTITVNPSILVQSVLSDGRKKELWHGFLERGVWRGT